MSPDAPPLGGDAHLEHPRSDRTPHPSRFLLHSPVRWLARLLIRALVRVRVHGVEHVPTEGPVIFAGNHLGISDGPLLAIFSPRPVHALTKEEMFDGRLGGFLLASGQIRLDRFNPDPAGVRACLRVLRDGGAIGIFPEGRRGGGELDRFHRGAAYFALASGAPVVPVIFFGTREPGGGSDSLPRLRGRVDIVFGPAYQLGRAPWPRRREQLDRASVLLREHMLAHLERARASTGRSLPGPLPTPDVDPDPATGITEQGAP